MNILFKASLVVVFLQISALNIFGYQKSISKVNYTYLPNVFRVRDSVCYKGYVCRIETSFLGDSVAFEEIHLFQPIILNQRIVFLNKGKVLSICYNKSKKIYQKDIKGNKILMLSSVYSYVRVVSGKYHSAFAIGTYGGCNSCSETLAFYSLTGILAFNNGYPAKWKLFLKKYGISNYNNSDKDVVVYPPTRASMPGRPKGRRTRM